MRAVWLVAGLAACEGKTEDTGGTDGTTIPTTDTDTTLTGTHAAACAGPVTGTFAGDLEGPIEGELLQTGRVNFRFYSEVLGANLNASGIIEEDGTISGEESGLIITGTFDLVGCTGGGDWDDPPRDLAGTWEISTL